jgi:hypothetical protein
VVRVVDGTSNRPSFPHIGNFNLSRLTLIAVTRERQTSTSILYGRPFWRAWRMEPSAQGGFSRNHSKNV